MLVSHDLLTSISSSGAQFMVGLSFSIPFDNELLFLWIITLWSLKIFFRDSLLMLLFYSLPLRSRTSGDIRLLLGIFLTFEKCPRNCSKTGISQVFDLWPCEEQHPGGFGKRSGDPHSLNLNNFYIFWDVIMQKMHIIFNSYFTVALTTWFPQVNRLQYCDWVERDNSNRNALVWKIFPSHPSVFLHFIVPIVVTTNLHHLMFHHVNQVTPHMFNIVAKVLVYENNLYWREDVLDDPEDDLALSTGSIHHDELTKRFRS